MLGKTAGGLFWMFRYLERAENTARLVDAGFRIALTRSKSAEKEWQSIIRTAGASAAFDATHDSYTGANVIDFLLREKTNPSSVLSVTEAARNNAKLVRTALTRETWEATNECWMTLSKLLARRVSDQDLPDVLTTIRQQSALVRGATHGTMMRNDIFNFIRLGTFMERADSTARILDVKYYVLLPSVSLVGSSLDNVQWETILRSVSAFRSYSWVNTGEMSPKRIADFLVLDKRMPRSLAFCCTQILDNLNYLREDYRSDLPSFEMGEKLKRSVNNRDIDDIFDEGLHEFLRRFLNESNALSVQIQKDYRFTE